MSNKPSPIYGAPLHKAVTPSTRAFPTIWTALIWIVIFFASQLIVGGLVTIIMIAANGGLGDLAKKPDILSFVKTFPAPIIWGMLVSGIVTVACAAFYLSRNERFTKIGLDTWSNIKLSHTLIACVSAMAAAYLFNYLYSTHVFSNQQLQLVTKELIGALPKTPANWVLLLFAISILPGIAEELIFRGLLQKSLISYMPAGFAIALSAFVFAGVHGQLYAIPGLMALGAAFGYIYHKTGSLRLAIALHAINNALVLAFGA
jgi:uncharacterized protein